MENKIDTIGKRLQVIREIRNLQPKDVHDAIGISLGNLHTLENDKAKPSADALIKLSQLYGVTTDWILFGDIHEDETIKTNHLSIPVPNIELGVYFSRIAQIWEEGDEETKAWVMVQLRRAFPEVEQKIRKNQK